ncbi:MAG TPA: hypothetical protein VGU02_09305 [Gaiellaceae bacterium]|nr:hypothetical protein [Gaiellaceae bacterium]
MDTPFGFDVELDPGLFTLDALDALYHRGVAQGKAGAQDADPGFERKEDPPLIPLERPLAEELAARKLHVWFSDVPEWAPEYGAARDKVLDAAGIDRSQRLFHLVANIRIFSPEGPVALHADPETQINVGVGGRNVWHFSWPSGLSQEEHENLLHGGHFLRWRELEIWKTFDLAPGNACAAPPRWPHWLEHPGPDPAVSFEVGFFTVEDIRDRKVWDVNWMLRKTRVVKPRPPRESAGNDRLKHRVFDAISVATRRGTEFRGV